MIALNDVTGNDQSSVAGAGFVVVVKCDQLPTNNFFVPGRVFAARVRHSSFPGK
jgi:hypothetical protein